MYHIVKSKSKRDPFQVVNIGVNGEVINSSEPLSSKQKSFKNIIANMDSVYSDTDNNDFYCVVQDDTLKKPKAYRLYDTGKKVDDIQAKPKYIPGKNKKK